MLSSIGMKIIVLGAGVTTSHYLPEQNFNLWPPAFFVTWDNEALLLDCSQAVQQRLEHMGIDHSKIHHIAITHPHPDHCAPIHFLQSTYVKGLYGEQFKNKHLTFYGPDYLIDNFQTLWNIHLPERINQYFDWPKLSLMAMSKGDKSITIGSGVLTAKKVYHGWGRCDAVAYRLETPRASIAYSGDTGDCDGVRQIAKNADLFICECSGRVGDSLSKSEYGHLDPYTIGDIAAQATVKKLVLSHYTGLDSNEAVINEIQRAGYRGEITFAKDFSTISID